VFSPNDTIVAIATPLGRGGLGVVRLSGPSAVAIASDILDTADPLEPRYATLTRVRDLAGRAVDGVVATFFKGPHSYTGEDSVEISAHGSPIVLKEILRSAIGAGARMATAGEFTLRAFLNGKLDLIQAEAVGDLVEASTAAQARAAFDQLNGTLTGEIARLDEQLMDVIARLEASLDFPEDGFHFVSVEELGDGLKAVGAGLDRLLDSARQGRLIREGLQIGIFGKPNVGKSSLFNYLVGADRAIVTEVPGTTRDLVTESVDFEGIRLGLIDTAGIRATVDVIETEGVVRSRRALVSSDVSIVILDASVPLEDVDFELLRAAGESPGLVVANKCDLVSAWGPAEFGTGEPPLRVSLKTGAGLADLRRGLLAVLVGTPTTPALEREWLMRESPLITNVRHEGLLREARVAVSAADERLGEAGASWSEEFVLADLQRAKGALEDVTGKRTSEDLLRHIFERFCVGK
jgi:tRNA modification GTPase